MLAFALSFGIKTDRKFRIIFFYYKYIKIIMAGNIQEYILELRTKILAEKERLIICFSPESSLEIETKTAAENKKSVEKTAAIKAVLCARSSKKKRIKGIKENANQKRFWE